MKELKAVVSFSPEQGHCWRFCSKKDWSRLHLKHDSIVNTNLKRRRRFFTHINLVIQPKLLLLRNYYISYILSGNELKRIRSLTPKHRCISKDLLRVEKISRILTFTAKSLSYVCIFVAIQILAIDIGQQLQGKAFPYRGCWKYKNQITCAINSNLFFIANPRWFWKERRAGYLEDLYHRVVA